MRRKTGEKEKKIKKIASTKAGKKVKIKEK